MVAEPSNESRVILLLQDGRGTSNRVTKRKPGTNDMSEDSAMIIGCNGDVISHISVTEASI